MYGSTSSSKISLFFSNRNVSLRMTFVANDPPFVDVTPVVEDVNAVAPKETSHFPFRFFLNNSLDLSPSQSVSGRKSVFSRGFNPIV